MAELRAELAARLDALLVERRRRRREHIANREQAEQMERARAERQAGEAAGPHPLAAADRTSSTPPPTPGIRLL